MTGYEVIWRYSPKDEKIALELNVERIRPEVPATVGCAWRNSRCSKGLAMPTAKQWLWIGTGVTALMVGVVSQAVSANIRENEPKEPDTVLVEFLAPGNAVRAKVNWTTPEGSRTYSGSLPLMNTKGTQGVAYRLPRGSAVSMTVTNNGCQGRTTLGFAGDVACRIKVDGYPIAYEDEGGYNASVTCSTLAKPPLG